MCYLLAVACSCFIGYRLVFVIVVCCVWGSLCVVRCLLCVVAVGCRSSLFVVVCCCAGLCHLFCIIRLRYSLFLFAMCSVLIVVICFIMLFLASCCVLLFIVGCCSLFVV